MLEISKSDKKEIRENSLVCLDVSYQTEILPEDLTQLVLRDLKGNTSVSALVFWKCNLDDACISALAAALEVDGRIINYIDLNSNRITDNGFTSLLLLNNIRKIDCSYNAITDKVVPLLLARDEDRKVNLLGNRGMSEKNDYAVCLHFGYVEKNGSDGENNSQLEEDDNEQEVLRPSKKLK